MATETTASLPDYIQAAKANPASNRAAWYLNTAPTYAGIFLWFVFWDELPFNGLLAQGGLGAALLGIVLGGLICHFLFYLVPGLLGMKTGLPLYIVGTSTFGAVGGLFMPGFLMGLLQFGWLAVNTYFSSGALANAFTGSADSPVFYVLCAVWAAGAALIGLKGIQYVAKVATFLPLIPLAVIVMGLAKFAGSAGSFQPSSADAGGSGSLTAILTMAGLIVGFFATAGAAGVDFGMNSRDASDVQWGGIVGVLVATLVTAGAAVVIVAGAHAQGSVTGSEKSALVATNAMKAAYPDLYAVIMAGLTIAAFPGACFSSFIAANSFKTVMPRVNPFISVGIGALVSIALAVTGLASKLPAVFILIGASFGPICGAMCADYLLSGGQWSGPRAGFNPAGWGAWLLGFLVGILPNLGVDVPAASVVAFVVGFVVYIGLAKAGLQSAVVPFQPESAS